MPLAVAAAEPVRSRGESEGVKDALALSEGEPLALRVAAGEAEALGEALPPPPGLTVKDALLDPPREGVEGTDSVGAALALCRGEREASGLCDGRPEREARGDAEGHAEIVPAPAEAVPPSIVRVARGEEVGEAQGLADGEMLTEAVAQEDTVPSATVREGEGEREGEEEELLLPRTLPLAPADAEVDGLALTDWVLGTERVGRAVPVPPAASVAEGLADGQGVALSDREATPRVGDTLALVQAVGAEVLLAPLTLDTVAPAAGEAVSCADAVAAAEAVAPLCRLALALGVDCKDAVAAALRVGRGAEGVGAALPVACRVLPVGLALALPQTVADALALRSGDVVAVPSLLGLGVGESVRSAVELPVALPPRVLAEGQGEEVPLNVAERVPCELREGVGVPESIPCRLAVGRGLAEGVVEAEPLCDAEAVPLLLTVALAVAEAEAVPRGGEGVAPAVPVPVPLPLPLPPIRVGLATADMEPEAVELALPVAAVGGEGEDAEDALPAPLAEGNGVGVGDREKLPVAEAALVREAVGVPEGEALPVAPPPSMGEGVGVPPVGVAVGG